MNRAREYQPAPPMEQPRPRKRKRRRKLRIFPCLVLMAMITAITVGSKPVFNYLHHLDFSFPTFFHVQRGETPVQTTVLPKDNLTVDLTKLHSDYAILINYQDKTIAAEHNSQQRIYPASLTKIMTAILAIEQTNNLKETITLTPTMFANLQEANASIAGFSSGETVSKETLLYGALLPSGAECCLGLAESVAGSEEEFVKQMNKKAQELGMKNTHFTNSIGLHDKNHYSTAEDLSLLLAYALENNKFRQIFTAKTYLAPATLQHPEGVTLTSTMFPYLDGTELTAGKILGGKTGYTQEAGQCLASLATVKGTEYLLITAKADGSPQTEPLHILDAVAVYRQLEAN